MRRGPRLLLAAVIAVGALYLWVFRGVETAALTLGDTERRPLSEGLEVVEARLWRGWSVASRLVVIYADPARYDARLFINSGQAPLADLERDALLVVNAGYFTPERKPTGLLVSEGKVLSPFIPEGGAAGSGVLVVESDDRIALLERERVGRRLFTGASLAIQAGPRVIEPGGQPGIRTDDGARANRTVIGVDGRGWLVIATAYASDGGLAKGPTLFELQRVLTEGLGRTAAELALTAALNLDGGPSTGLHLRHPEREIEQPEVGRVHSVLTLRARR